MVEHKLMLYVYSRENCSWCENLKQRLEMQEVEYVEMKIGRELTREEFLAEFPGVRTVPYVVEVSDLPPTPIGGYEAAVKYLNERQNFVQEQDPE